MIRVALVEDDKNYADEMTEYLKRYEKECGEKIQVAYFPDGAEIVEDYQANYDIILMDIEMKFMDGMTAAEHIRQVDNEVVIIFITNMPQYVMQGYKVDALDYVLKPVNYFAFSQRIERALTRMKKRKKKFLSIAVQGGMQKIDVSQILYVEVLNHDLVLHTKKGNFNSKGSMKDIETMLVGESFYRCNKCYLVNLEYVDGVQNFDVYIGDEILQVSRAKKKQFMDTLNDYINEVSK